MRWRDEFDLPERFATVIPRAATEIIVALVMTTAAIGPRLLIALAFQDVVAFALVFPAVAAATLLAGPRSGLMVIACAQLLTWYLVLPIKGSFRFASASGAFSLILTTAAQLLLLWAISSYRGAVRRAALIEASQNAKLESALELLSQQAALDAQLREQEAFLRETRQNLQAIYDASADGLTLCRAIKTADGRIVDYQVIEVNQAHAELTGATREAMLASRVSVIAPPVDPRWFDSADQAVKTGVMQQFDVRSPATQRWLNIRVSRVSDDLFQQTFVDVTDRHRLDEQRTEMLKEMSHRVMNNFQMMASFLHIQASGAPPSVKAHLRTAESRVQVLAELHSLLAYTESAQEIDAAAYIGQLCRRLGAVIDRPGEITIACVCEPLMLATDKIVPLGFVISELVTNAAKYAFPPPAQGVISVTLSRTLDCWTLTIRDNGRGLVGAVETPGSEPPVGGLGTRLVRRFVQRIGGEIVTVCDGGLRHDIRFHPES